MTCVFKARINPQFNRAVNPKGVAGFKKQTELLPIIACSGTLFFFYACGDRMWS